MLTCNDANALIVRTIDDALSGGERAALRRHLVSCARCRGEYETQHEVRRLLVLHMHDRLPDGFEERLSARLARTARPLPSEVVRGALSPGAAPRFAEAADARRGMRGRTWALRLIPLAATLALIVAGASVRDVAPRQAVSTDAPSSTVPGTHTGAAAGQPRAFTSITLPRPDRGLRRHRPSPVSAEDVERVPVRPPTDDGQRNRVDAVAESGGAAEHSSRVAKVQQGISNADASARGTTSEPRGQERARVASRGGNTSGQRANGEPVDDERVDGERADGERAASQQPGILPRPAVPIPHARPAMPAPSAVLPDRTIPPL